MKKKALYKSIQREIFQSKTRFLSILGIILLGVCFYVGIKATGPNMIDTADHYFRDKRLMHSQIVSTMGLYDEDIRLVEDNPDVLDFQAGYSLDVNLTNENVVMKLFSYDTERKNNLNDYRVIEGRLPKQSGEIALDSRADTLGSYNIGDTFTLKTDEEAKANVAKTSFKIVGFVNSPLYIDKVSRGNTSVGKGSIDYFGVIPEEDFNMDAYTELAVRFKDLERVQSYSDTYDQRLAKHEAALEKQFADRPAEKLAEITSDAQKEIDEAESELRDGQNSLDEAQSQLDAALSEVTQNLSMLTAAEAMGQPVPQAQKDQLTSAKAELDTQQAELDEKKAELADSYETLAEEKQKLSELEAPEYFFLSRDDTPAYSEYHENAKRLSSIASVFPVFFFMIAALVCLTTMTRMVDEKRSEIGTLKALGYANWEISLKFIVYATLASVAGSVLGLIIGFNTFPKIIFNAYGSMYNLPDVRLTYYTSYSVQSIVVALICTLLSSLIVLRIDLLSTPAALMRPKAPKPGKRILLERVTWLWSRLNFNQKVTARNLFRYKQRMLMTVIGIAGCTALMLTGFGVRDSIGDIVTIQFNKLWHYDATITLNDDSSDAEKEAYQAALTGLPEYEDQLQLAQNTFEVVKQGYTTHDVTVDVPQQTDNLDQFVLFNDRKTGAVYSLDDEGAIINEKLAKLFDIEAGDTVTLKNADRDTYRMKVSHIVENYTMHFAYMTPAYYEKVFGETPVYNVDLVRLNTSLSDDREKDIAAQLMATDGILNVSYTTQIGQALDDTMNSLNIVVWVLIVSAAMLAFIVLYNLTNINISERIRELSTIKVLGFYDNEVTQYVYRENNLLTLLGVGVGCLLGILLHGFVLQTAEVDLMMFPKTIHAMSYVYAILLTFLFSLIVMMVMHRKLKKVDMIEALKSNE